MRKLFSVILILTLTAGCKTSFKSGFRDFNAYYNTYYNAKKSFNSGEEKSEEQQRNYNTLQAIRIHETPMGAGSGEFQNAIDKGADILRKHDDTKWVDNALEIIGKSYFYRQEYFSADQKFDELFISSEDPEMKQKAVFWKGRVLLELEAHNQGVQYLTEHLALFDGEWKGSLEAQVRAVLGQHYVERENWVNALDQLTISVRYLPKRSYKERGYFLIGQLYENLGNNEEAYDAYDQVGKNYTNYDLQFEAKKKKAEVARALGRSDDAYRVFSSMVRDDKNTEFVSELNFELGKTEQDRGNYAKAREIYTSILRDRRNRPDEITKAKAYNGLAEIYRFHFNDFERAAAYYDSASSSNAKREELPEDFNAEEFAQSFGDYARLKDEIHLQDSLIWMGSLSEVEFDSVLAELERKKREEIARLQREQEARRNTLINVNAPSAQNNSGENQERNGFLNYKNPVMLTDAAQQFNAVWGGRPLADNWRVSSILVNQIVENEEGEGTNTQAGVTQANEVFVSIDLSRIPFTPEDQDSVREEISKLNYELGNLFFLSLNLPDSAEYYFKKVIEERPNSNVVPVSLYSLSELYILNGDTLKATEKGEELLENYPSSIYADRVVEKYNLSPPEVTDKVELSPTEVFISISNDETLNEKQRADSLLVLEKSIRGSSIGAKSLQFAIDSYITLAKEDSLFSSNISKWNEVNQDWVSTQKDFKAKQDSAKYILSDSTSAATDSLFAISILDSTLTTPDLSPYFPYQGVYWDSTRSKVQLYLAEYSSFENVVLIRRLNAEFEPPKSQVADTVVSQIEDPGVALREGYLSCEDIDQEVFIRGGMQQFLSLIELPKNVTEDQISFLFFFNTRGVIEEFKLSSDTQNKELIDEFVTKIDANITFDPVLVDGSASNIQCEISFPISQ
ncbi:MAG: hypothetical protein ED557_06535 [Balneola sp.]|nr:MAG: hypothetical protein ED557_06535 [Balneola sp.]